MELNINIIVAFLSLNVLPLFLLKAKQRQGHTCPSSYCTLSHHLFFFPFLLLYPSSMLTDCICTIGSKYLSLSSFFSVVAPFKLFFSKPNLLFSCSFWSDAQSSLPFPSFRPSLLVSFSFSRLPKTLHCRCVIVVSYICHDTHKQHHT